MAVAEGELDLTKLSKTEVISKFRVNNKDVGSPEVQVALITKRLQGLGDHFKKHTLDRHSERGLLLLVSGRKQLLDYLKKVSVERYRTLIGSLGLRK